MMLVSKGGEIGGYRYNLDLFLILQIIKPLVSNCNIL